MKYNIEIKKSLGDIKLTMNEVEIIELIGNPEDVEVLEDGDDDFNAVIWYYDKLEISLFFENSNMSLFCIESNHKDLELFGQKLSKMTSEEILEMFKSNGFADIERDEESWGEMRLSIAEAAIDFYFTKGELISVNFGVAEN